MAGNIRSAGADGGHDNAMAEALFQDGRTLLSQGRTAEACGKFASSQRIDPQIGTMLFLATCHESEGKTATAWAEFNAALGSLQRSPDARDARREAYARQHRDDLTTKLSRLILTATATVTGLEVKVDDQELDAGSLGTPLPVDPGIHTIALTAPLRRPWSTTLQVAEGPIDVAVTLPALDPLAPASVPVVAAREPEGALARPNALDADPHGQGAGRTLAYVSGALGLAGVLVGSVAGIWAIVDKTRADHGSCDGKLCTQHGLDLYAEASTSAWVSTGGFSLAAVGLGVGASAWLLSAPSKGPPAGVQGAGLTVGGVW